MNAAITAVPLDDMEKILEKAIGRNAPYPNEAQLLAHRAKQALHEKHFAAPTSKEQAK